MSNLHGRIPTKGESYQEHDTVEHRLRVATHIDGNSVVYEDTNFTSGDSPSVLDVLTDLGRTAHKGFVENVGPGDLQIEVSFDGTTYGGIYTLSGGQALSIDDEKVAKIRITYQDPTGYKARLG